MKIAQILMSTFINTCSRRTERREISELVSKILEKDSNTIWGRLPDDLCQRAGLPGGTRGSWVVNHPSYERPIGECLYRIGKNIRIDLPDGRHMYISFPDEKLPK